MLNPLTAWKERKAKRNRIDVISQAIIEHFASNPNAGIQELIKVGDAANDVKGEFLPDMTEEEVLAYERNERLGWKKLTDHLPWNKPATTDVANS